MEYKPKSDMELLGMSRKDKLFEFYNLCLDAGCLDMKDDSQSLRAKVFAMDLKLHSKKIDDLFDEAKNVYDEKLAAKQEKERLLKEENEKIAAYNAIEGEWLFTIATTLKDLEKIEKRKFCVYRRPDGTIYGTYGEGYSKVNEISFDTKRNTYITYDHHPEKIVYTGASSGGISMGGFHTEKEHYQEKRMPSKNGTVVFSLGKDMGFGVKTRTAETITVSDVIASHFRRDKIYKKYFNEDNIANCYKYNYDYEKVLKKTKTSSFIYPTHIMTEEDSLMRPLGECKEIVDLINRFLYGPYPMNDEQTYQSAITLSQAFTSDELKKAVEFFDALGDYKDSAQRKTSTQKMYQEVLFKEKEQKVLEFEKNRTKIKAKKSGVLIAVLVLVALLISSPFVAKKILSSKAESYIATKEFDKAYKISTIIRSEEIRDKAIYEKAKHLRETGKFDESSEYFRNLGAYEDSADQELMTYYEKAQQLRENGDYAAAIEVLDSPTSAINSTASKDLLEKYQAEVKEWKYDYILNHKNSEDENTFNYVVDFRREQYRRDEMDAIYQELFEWQLKVVVNDNENDTTTNKFTFETSEDVYVHVTAIKGSPSYKGDIVCTFYDSDLKEVESGSVQMYVGESGVIEFSDGIYFVPGTYTMEIKCDLDVVYTKTIKLT